MLYLKERLWNDDSGAQFLEYALLAGLIAIGVAAAVTIFGQEIYNLFDAMKEKVIEIADNL